jgi:hypothetical protein
LISLSNVIDQAAAVAAVLAERRTNAGKPTTVSTRPRHNRRTGRRPALVLASPDQLPTLAELDTEPPILVNGPPRPWIAALRRR